MSANSNEGLGASPVTTLEVTNPATVVAAMCEDCACPKPNATVEGLAPSEAGAVVLAAATLADEQLQVSFAVTGSN